MAFLKNISESLMGRVIPDVAASIFPEEASRLSSFKEKLADAKEIYNESADKIKATTDEFAGVSKISKTLAGQVKSGKFGTDKKWEDDYFDRKMTGGGSGGGSDMDDSSLDELDNFDFGDADDSSGDTTNNITNTQNNFISDDSSSNEFSNISDKIVQGNSAVNNSIRVGGQVAAAVGSRMLGLTSRISSDIATIADFHTSSTSEFYKASMEFYQLQTDLGELISNGFPKLITNADAIIAERESKQAAAMAQYTDGDEDLASLLDPHRLMTKLTDDTMFNMLFDENMSVVGSMLAKFSSDPLGVIVGSALGAGISNMFGSQIEFIKHQAGAMEYKIQEILEQWSISDKSSPLGFLKHGLGNLLKVERDTYGEVDVGGYTNKDISFDVQTKKAIVDVIPMYLAKILKAVSNSDDYEVYDYKTARFGGSNDMVADLQKQALDISEGNTYGGLGDVSSRLMENNEDLTEEMRSTIRKELLTMSRMGNSANTDLGNVAFEDEDTTDAFNKMYTGLTQKQKYEMDDAFRQHKFKLQKQKAQFEKDLKFSGIDQAAILNNYTPDVGSDDEVERTQQRITNGLNFGNNNGTGNPIIGPPRPDLVGPLPQNPISARIDSASNAVRDSANDKIINPLNKWLDDGKDTTGKTFKEKLVDKFDNRVLVPLKTKLLGKSDREAEDTTLLSSMNIFMNDTVLMPFKKILVGEERAVEMGFFKSLSTRFEESALIPFKQKLLGKDTDIETAKNTSLWKSIGFRVDESIIMPFKQKMLGKDIDKETVKNTSVWGSINDRLNNSVLVPFKQLLLGKDVDKETVKSTGLWQSISDRVDKSILMPFKQVLLGKDVDSDTVKGTSVWQSISSRFDKSVLFPFKKLLLGGNEKKAASFSLWKSINHRLDRSIFMPLKTILIGNNGERGAKEIAGTSLFKSLKIGFTEKVVEPLSGMLFGQDKKKLGFFKNLGATMSPFFNKLLFGQDKASKGGFIENLKSEGKALWSSLWSGAKDKFFLPAVDTFKEFFGPVLKDFSKTLGSEIKHFSGVILTNLGATINGSMVDGIKSGATNLFKTVFGDETVDLLRTNIILPLQDLTKTLTDNMSKVFKFLLRLPLNFLKGITDTMKINRVESGRGDYSEEETARLMALKKSGKAFNFLDLGESKEQDAALNELNSTSSKRDKTSIFNRIFSSSTKNPPEETVADITPSPVERVENAKTAESNEKQKINSTAPKVETSIIPPTVSVAESKANALKAVSDAKAATIATDTLASNSTLATNIAGSTAAATSATVATDNLVNSTNVLNTNLDANSKATNSVFTDLANKIGTLITQLSPTSNNINTSTDTSNNSGHKASLGDNSTHANGEMANIAIVRMNNKMSALLPTTVGIASTASSIHRFMKENLSKVSARVENIVRMMRKKNRGSLSNNGSGGNGSNDGPGFLSNPFYWLTSKLTGAVGFAAGALGSLGGSAFKLVGALLSLPGKIAGSLVSVVSSVTNAALTITKEVVEGVAIAAKGIITGIGSIVSSLAVGLGKVAAGLVDVVGTAAVGIAKFTAAIAGPLIGAVGALVTGVVKGIVPVIDAVAKGAAALVDGLVAVTTGIAKFTWALAAGAARTLARVTLGASFGSGGGGLGGGGTNRVHVTNFFDLLKLSKVTPMHVFVRGGKVELIQPKAKRIIRSTNFVDNIENRLGSKIAGKTGKKKGEVDNNSLISDSVKDALATGAGVTGGTLLAKVVSKLGGGIGKAVSVLVAALGLGKLAGLFKKLGLAALVASTRIPLIGGGIGKLMDKFRRAPLVGPPRPPVPPVQGRLSKAKDAIKTKLSNLRRPPVNPPVGPPRPPVPPTPAGAGSKVLGALGKVGKGLGVGAAIGMGGNFAADMIFDEGTAGNAVMGTAATAAGWGAMVGSIVPGLGTAIGAVVGGILGTIYEGGPRLIKWFEDKFEVKIKKATEILLAIPENLTKFVEELPQKITNFTDSIPEKLEGFLSDLPQKIVKLFTPEEGWQVDANGAVIEKQPSILGALFRALGGAMWSITKSLPKIVLSLVSGLAQTMAAVTITAAGSVGNILTTGIKSIGLLIGKTFEQAKIRGMEMLGNVPGLGSLIGIDNTEATSRMNAIETEYDDKAAAVTASHNDNSSTITNISKTVTNFLSNGKPKAKTKSKFTPNMLLTGNATTPAKANHSTITGILNSAKAAAPTVPKMVAPKPDTATKAVTTSSGVLKNTVGKITAPSSTTTSFSSVLGGAGPSAAAGVPIVAGGGVLRNAPGTGGSGSYAAAPSSRGRGWAANRDLLAYAGTATGVPLNILAKIAAIESGFDPNAKAKTSSAAGLYQFIDGTWRATKNQFATKYGIPSRSHQYDAKASALLGAAHIKDNMNALSKVKSGINATDIYLAHFLGLGGARKFLAGLKSNPGQAATNLVGGSQASANKTIFYLNGQKRTAAAVYNLFTQRLDTKANTLGAGVGSGGTYGNSSEVAGGGNIMEGGSEGGGGGSSKPSITDADALEAKLMYAEWNNKMAGVQDSLQKTGEYKNKSVVMDMKAILAQFMTGGGGQAGYAGPGGDLGSGGGVMKAGGASIDSGSKPARAAAYASRRALGKSVGRCAAYIRAALKEGGGYSFTNNASAYQYHTNGTMASMGMVQISTGTPWQVGDVLVINRKSGKPHGHIQIWDGRNWVSDFRQNTWKVYGSMPGVALYRDKNYLNGASTASGWQTGQSSGGGVDIAPPASADGEFMDNAGAAGVVDDPRYKYLVDRYVEPTTPVPVATKGATAAEKVTTAKKTSNAKNASKKDKTTAEKVTAATNTNVIEENVTPVEVTSPTVAEKATTTITNVNESVDNINKLMASTINMNASVVNLNGHNIAGMVSPSQQQQNFTSQSDIQNYPNLYNNSNINNNVWDGTSSSNDISNSFIPSSSAWTFGGSGTYGNNVWDGTNSSDTPQSSISTLVDVITGKHTENGNVVTSPFLSASINDTNTYNTSYSGKGIEVKDGQVWNGSSLVDVKDFVNNKYNTSYNGEGIEVKDGQVWDGTKLVDAKDLAINASDFANNENMLNTLKTTTTRKDKNGNIVSSNIFNGSGEYDTIFGGSNGEVKDGQVWDGTKLVDITNKYNTTYNGEGIEVKDGQVWDGTKLVDITNKYNTSYSGEGIEVKDGQVWNGSSLVDITNKYNTSYSGEGIEVKDGQVWDGTKLVDITKELAAKSSEFEANENMLNTLKTTTTRKDKNGNIVSSNIFNGSGEYDTIFGGSNGEVKDNQVWNGTSLVDVNQLVKEGINATDINENKAWDGINNVDVNTNVKSVLSTFFDSINGESGQAIFGNPTNPDAVKVTMDDIHSNSAYGQQYRDRAIEATKVTNFDSGYNKTQVDEKENAELKAQTLLLREIATNTGKANTMSQQNFFTESNKKSNPVPKSEGINEKTQALQAEASINMTYQDIRSNLDEFPTYIQPGKGALAVSRGGTSA